MDAAITLSQLGKSYDGKVWATRHVNFSLNPGETAALVGHNGAGKTTLMKMILGLIRPSEGNVQILGENPATGQFEARRSLGYLPENVSFNTALTGLETLQFYAQLKGLSRSHIAPVLDLVGLSLAAKKRVGSYSKGMRQRLGLAQALIGEPKILLLDEPTSGLDPALRQHFYAILNQLRDKGTAILLSSHALTELEERANRVIVMNQGITVGMGTLDELRHLAKLPSFIRIAIPGDAKEKLTEILAPFGGGTELDSGHISLEIPQENKMALLKRLLETDVSVMDIDIIPPSLDSLYAHFLMNQGNRA